MPEKRASTRGWSQYFHYRNSSAVLAKVKMHAEDRLRTHLMKRHKVKDRGTGFSRFPNQALYACYGVYKVPTTAGWKQRVPWREEHRKAVCGNTACTV